jgi:hypothetical protein
MTLYFVPGLSSAARFPGAVAAAILAGLTLGYVIGCTGWVNPDNASNKNTPACQVVGAITIIGWVLILIFAGGRLQKKVNLLGAGPTT